MIFLNNASGNKGRSPKALGPRCMIPPEEWRGGECIMRATGIGLKKSLEPPGKEDLLVPSKALKWNLFLMLLLVKWN